MQLWICDGGEVGTVVVGGGSRDSLSTGILSRCERQSTVVNDDNLFKLSSIPPLLRCKDGREGKEKAEKKGYKDAEGRKKQDYGFKKNLHNQT